MRGAGPLPADEAAGWSVRHLPIMTIIHHAGKGGRNPRMAAQDAYARRQYAHKHFSAPHRALYLSAIGTRHALRAVGTGGSEDTRARRRVARSALRTLARPSQPPFTHPPQTAMWLEAALDPANRVSRSLPRSTIRGGDRAVGSRP